MQARRRASLPDDRRYLADDSIQMRFYADPERQAKETFTSPFGNRQRVENPAEAKASGRSMQRHVVKMGVDFARSESGNEPGAGVWIGHHQIIEMAVVIAGWRNYRPSQKAGQLQFQ